jgi:hypothetical protein
MTFTVNSLTRCAGQSHYVLNITVTGGPTGDVRVDTNELGFEPLADLGETRQGLVGRCRSAGKEANAGTFAQWQAALVGKSFKL